MSEKKKVIINRILGKRIYCYTTFINPQRIKALVRRLQNVIDYQFLEEENITFKSDTEKILHFLKTEYPNSFTVDEIKKKVIVNISTESIARILRRLAKKRKVKKIKEKNKILKYIFVDKKK